MAEGPGKYDAVCTMARELTEAACAIVIVFGGRRGDGFSVQVDSRIARELGPKSLARILRDMASQIEREGQA